MFGFVCDVLVDFEVGMIVVYVDISMVCFDCFVCLICFSYVGIVYSIYVE